MYLDTVSGGYLSKYNTGPIIVENGKSTREVEMVYSQTGLALFEVYTIATILSINPKASSQSVQLSVSSHRKLAVVGTLAVGPSFGTLLGGTVITVSGPCFDELVDTSNTQCKFGDIVTKAEIIDSTRARCVLPMLLTIGRMEVMLSTNYGESNDHRGIITLGK